jgi:hypothetical protein
VCPKFAGLVEKLGPLVLRRVNRDLRAIGLAGGHDLPPALVAFAEAAKSRTVGGGDGLDHVAQLLMCIAFADVKSSVLMPMYIAVQHATLPTLARTHLGVRVLDSAVKLTMQRPHLNTGHSRLQSNVAKVRAAYTARLKAGEWELDDDAYVNGLMLDVMRFLTVAQQLCMGGGGGGDDAAVCETTTGLDEIQRLVGHPGSAFFVQLHILYTDTPRGHANLLCFEMDAGGVLLGRVLEPHGIVKANGSGALGRDGYGLAKRWLSVLATHLKYHRLKFGAAASPVMRVDGGFSPKLQSEKPLCAAYGIYFAALDRYLQESLDMRHPAVRKSIVEVLCDEDVAGVTGRNGLYSVRGTRVSAKTARLIDRLRRHNGTNALATTLECAEGSTPASMTCTLDVVLLIVFAFYGIGNLRLMNADARPTRHTLDILANL